MYSEIKTILIVYAKYEVQMRKVDILKTYNFVFLLQQIIIFKIKMQNGVINEQKCVCINGTIQYTNKV